MLRKIKRTAALFLLMFCLLDASAQQGIHSGGGVATGSTGTETFSIGQLFTLSNTGSSGYISEGVQQAYEIYSYYDITEVASETIEFECWPNPFADVISITMKSDWKAGYFCKIYNMQGELVAYSPFNESMISMDVSQLKPATYFLQISANNEKIKIYKLIKNY